MATGRVLSETVARLRDDLNSIYTQKELETAVNGGRPRAAPASEAGPSAYRASAADSDSEDSDGKSSLSSLTDGETDDPFCTRRRAKDLDDIIQEGRGRLVYLEKKLKTAQRVEAIKELADWFEHRAPEVCREMEELNSLEQRHNDDQVDAITSAAGLATKEMEEEVRHAREKVDHFYHHIKDEMGGAKGMRRFEEQRRTLQLEYNKLNVEKDDEVQLQQAVDELQRLQDRYHEISEPLHGLEAVDHDEQQRINELKQAISLKQARLGDLQRSVDESGIMLTSLEKIMAAIKFENRGGLTVLEPQLQAMAAKLKDKAQKVADMQLERNKSVSNARAKAGEEEDEADRLEKQVKEMEDETKSRLGIMRIVAAEEVVSVRRGRKGSTASAEADSSGDDDDDDSGEKVKAALVEVLQKLREQKSDLLKVQANAHHSKGKLATLKQARMEVRQNFRMALEKLQQEDQESMLAAASEERLSAVTPTEWRQHLERSWGFAKRDPELFAYCLWLDPIADDGDDFIMGLAGSDSPRKAAYSSNADDGGGGSERADFRQGLSELRRGQQQLWQQVGSLEDTLCIRQPPEPEQLRDSSSTPRPDEAEAFLQKLRDALEAEDTFQRGALQEIANESQHNAASLEWLSQRVFQMVVPAAKRAAQPRRPADSPPRGARTPRRRQ